MRRRKGFQCGSAFILSVVLTSLLAVVGVTFMMITRVDRIATSGISENKALDSAARTIIAKLSEELVLDVPGVAGQEYYDYPATDSDAWLASLEPYGTFPDYYWGHISDVTGYLGSNLFRTEDVDVKSVGLATSVYVREYPELRVNSAGAFLKPSGMPATDGVSADADGDGIADSKWIELEGIMTTKGEPIYAAIRVIDNGGMLNVNTGYKFDPDDSSPDRIDGSSQTQIDLFSLSERGTGNTINQLDDARRGTELWDLDNYIRDVVWRYEIPDGNYTPFDVGDELKLRNRYIINYNSIVTRVDKLWSRVFDGKPYVPRESVSDPNNWFWYANNSSSDPCDYDYRHIATTYNMDRILSPDGERLVNVNTADPCSLYVAIVKAFGFDIYEPNDVNDPGFSYASATSAQIAVNLVDYRDNDPNVTMFFADGNMYYGFESQPFISEMAAIIDSNIPFDPSNNYYAVELHNPFNLDIDLTGFELLLSDVAKTRIPLSGTIEKYGYHVIANDFSGFTIDAGATTQTDASLKLSGNYVDTSLPLDGIPDTWDNYNITLISDANGPNLIDYQGTEKVWFAPSGSGKSFQRETTNWNVVYQTTMIYTEKPHSLGAKNEVTLGGENYNLGLANSRFVTVGDILKVLRIGPTTDANGMIGKQLELAGTEEDVRMDVTEPVYQKLFNYLTVFDPADDGIDNDGDGLIDENKRDPNSAEWKVPGRININTAPWYVLAQLPWVSEKRGFSDSSLAEEIVKYRDDTLGGYRNIGQLNDIVTAEPNSSMDYYARAGGQAGGDEAEFPDLTGGDGAADDFEERDLIFSRISNLVTVRSDVFTAYILVRVGTDGGQKRVIAILDRSDVYPDGSGGAIGDVIIRVFHSVPDAR